MNPKYIITILILLALAGTASAWLPDYNHRIAITVNNGGASTLNYYQFNFTNDTNTLVAAGHMLASGADCRITDVSDNLIPFWNETAFNASGTKIWANATTLSVGDNTFYMYYGNSGASDVTDGDTTFEFFDDFQGAGWAIDHQNDTGNYGCWADHDIWVEDSDTIWIYHNRYRADTLYDIERRVYKISTNAITADDVLWTSDIEDAVPRITKQGTLYHLTFERKSGTTYALYKRTGTDGVAFANESRIDGSISSTHHIYSEIIEISSTEFWVYYSFRDGSNNWHIKKIVCTDGSYGSPSTVISFPSTYRIGGLNIYNFDNDYYFYYVRSPDSGNSQVEVRSSTDGTTFGSATTITSWSAYFAGIATVEQIGSDYYLFYSQPDVKIMKGTSPTSFSDLQTLHTTVNAQVATTVFDTDKVLLVWSYDFNPSDDGLTAEQLSFSAEVGELNTNKWTVTAGDWSATSKYLTTSIASANIQADFNSAYFAVDYRCRLGSTAINHHTDNRFIWVDADNYYDHVILSNYYDFDMRIAKRVGGVWGNLWDSANYDGTNTWHTYGFTRNSSGTFKLYRDGNYEGTTTNNEITTNNKISLYSSETSAKDYDDIRIRKYTPPEPTSSLGAEEDAPAGNDITLAANTYGFLCEDPSIAHPFNIIATGFAHEVCISWLNNSGECWEFYWSGDAYNTGLIIPKHDAYFVLMDGTGETVQCGVGAAETVAIPTGWYATYLRESTNYTLSQIKTDLEASVGSPTVTNLYTWDHNAGGTGAWVSVDVTPSHVVVPNQGFLINNMGAGFNWDGHIGTY